MLKESIKGYTGIMDLRKNVNIIKTDWRYMLMPVWFMNFRYKDKDYQFVMNGQTGKMAGKLPLSAGKLAGFGIGLFAVLSVLFILIGGAL